MRKIDRVFVACTKRDMRLTQICVASIRYWYPDIPICLLKDEVLGSFSTRELEEVWNARVWQTSDRVFGWGFSKLEPLFDVEAQRFLMLDSDIVLTGRVIDALQQFDSDFVVQEEVQPPSRIDDLYFRPGLLRQTVDPAFVGPLFTFNSGQWVGNGGSLRREDFGRLLEWTAPRRHRFPDVFNPSDQGVLNYVVLSKLAAGTVSVARTPFMKWGRDEIAAIDVEQLNAASPYPYVIHWAGLKHHRLTRMIRADILQFFETQYYRAIPAGALRKYLRILGTDVSLLSERAARFVRRALRRNSR